MAAIIGKFEEELTYTNVLKETHDHIRVAVSKKLNCLILYVTNLKSNMQFCLSQDKKFAMEIIGTSSPLVYSELVVMIDPTVYLRRRQQRILVMTTTSFHLLVPKYPYDRCTKRQQEIPLLWIEKIYADRIDGQIIFQIRPDYDLWLELPSKTHFIHLFSMLHKLQQGKKASKLILKLRLCSILVN